MNLFREPALMIGLTLGAYLWGQQLFLQYRKSWLNPVLVAIILIAIVLQIFRKFMCIYTILKNFVDKRNKLGLNFVI